MRARSFLSVGVVLLILMGCGGGGQSVEATQDVHSGRTRWAAQELRDYRFDFERQCFCVPEALEPVTLEVRGGSVHQVRSRRTGELMPASDAVPWFTIEQLFDQIEEAQAAGVQPVRVEYHTRGYPTVIEIGSLAADAGVHYTVASVEPLQ